MPGPINSTELRRLLLSLPGEAVKILYARYYNSLLRIAIGLTHNKRASEDIIQDTFTYIWENASRIGQPHERSIEHLLVKIVRNKSISYYKEGIYADKRKIMFINERGFMLRGAPVEADIIHTEITTGILALIRTFPNRERQCLLMKIEEELNNMEIASRLKVSVKAVERSLTSAKKRLRRHLNLKK